MSMAVAQKKSKSTVAGAPARVSLTTPNIGTVTPVDIPLIQRKSSCACGGSCPSCQAKGEFIQPKLKIGAPDDIYEQEADRVADQVINLPDSDGKRHRDHDAWEESIQIRPLVNTSPEPVQKHGLEEEAEVIIQAKISGGISKETSMTDGIAELLQGSGQPLSESEQNYFEPRFGVDLSDVRIHDDTRAADVAQSVNARAFTFGHHVVFGAGEYSSDTLAGKKLIAHELTHAMQQMQGPSNSHLEPRRQTVKNSAAHSSRLQTPVRRKFQSASVSIQREEHPDQRYTPYVYESTDSVDLTGWVVRLVNIMLTQANRQAVPASQFLIGVFHGRHRIDYYRGASFKGTVNLDPDQAIGVSPGLYRGGGESGSDLLRLYVDSQADRLIWREERAEDPERLVVNAMGTNDLSRVEQWGDGASLFFYVRGQATVSDDATSSEDDSDGLDVSEGDGGEGERVPAPEWARVLTRLVRSSLESAQQNVIRLARRTAGVAGKEREVARLRQAGGIADRVVLWHREGTPYLNVWATGDSRAIRLNQTDDSETTYGRVVAVTQAIYQNVPVAASQTAEEISLDLPGTGGEDGDFVPANHAAYPSEIRNLGPEIGIVDATHRFSMHINFSREGRWATLAAFGPRRYSWELIKLHDQSGQVAASDSGGRRIHRREGAVADLERDFSGIGEDLENSSTLEAMSALSGIDAGVRSVGTLIGTVVSLASQPSNEQGLQFQGAGTYIVRGLSARPPLEREDAPENAVVHAPSVSVYAIRVMTRATRARDLVANRDIDNIIDTLVELRQRLVESDPSERTELEQEISSLEQLLEQYRIADRASTLTYLNTTLSSARTQIQILDELEEAQQQSSDPNTYAPELRLLWVQLQLSSRTIAEERRRLEQSRSQLEAQQRSSIQAGSSLKGGRHFRPHVSFVPEDTGRAIPVLMMLGEDEDSTEGARIWVLIDISVPGHADRYEGQSSAAGAEGHAVAIRNAFNDFAGEIPYGRGTIGVRFTRTVADYIGTSVTVPEFIRAAPDSGARWRQRLESLATAASIAGLVITGPIGAVIGITGAVAGGAVAAYRIHRRWEGGYLELDLATALEITAIIGAVTGPLGAGAGRLARAGRWTAVMGQLERGIEIAGYLQLGSQVFVIPVTLVTELQAIDADQSISPGERAARRAMAFLNATRSGLEFVVSAHQTLGNRPAAPTESETTIRRPALESTDAPGGGTRQPVDDNVPRPQLPDVPEAVSTPDSRPRSRTREAPEHRTPRHDDESAAPRRETDDVTEPQLDDGIEIIDLPEGTVLQAPDDLATSHSLAIDMFETAYIDNPGNEVLLLKNSATGEYIIVQGDDSIVSLGRNNAGWAELLPPELRGRGRWIADRHTHPVDASGVTPLSSQWPSGGDGDFHAIAWESDMTGRAATHEIQFRTAEGLESTLYGYDPASSEPLWIDAPSPDGGRIIERFATIEAYHYFYQDRFGGPPSPTINNDFRGARRGMSEDTVPDARISVDTSVPPSVQAPGVETSPETRRTTEPRIDSESQRGVEAEVRVDSGPLTVPSETVTATGGSRRAANWEEIQDLVGQPAATADIPTDQYIRFQSNGRWVIRRRDANDSLFQFLTVDRAGRIQLSTTRTRASSTGFMNRMFRLVSNSDHPLHFLVSGRQLPSGETIYEWNTTERVTRSGRTQTGRYEGAEHAPVIQAGHQSAFATGEAQQFMLEDAGFNIQSGATIESAGAFSYKPAVEIDGVIIDRATALAYERLGLLIVEGGVRTLPQIEAPGSP